MSKYRIGIDIGGMSFKIGIVDENGNIAFRDVLKVTTNNSQEEMIELLANKVNYLIKTNNVSKDDILGIGIGAQVQSIQTQVSVIIRIILNGKIFQLWK